MKKLRWGILSTANIGVKAVIPAIQQSQSGEVVAIASRDLSKAISTAKQLGVPRVYGSYEDLLADKTVDAIYNPLPNHLHVHWSLEALAFGKHVLCEKPVGLSSLEVYELATAARVSSLLVMEAFMYRWHPQWQRARTLIQDNQIGKLTAIHAFFSYFNRNPNDYRHRAEFGGGGFLDIGCYAVSISRWLFGAEPQRVIAQLDPDPSTDVDRLSSGILDFNSRTAVFTCGTQLAPYQRVNLVGTSGRIEIEIPLNAPSDRPSRMWLHCDTASEEIQIPTCNQYALQSDGFARCMWNNEPPLTTLADSIANMQVLEALIRSYHSKHWESPIFHEFGHNDNGGR